MRHGLRCFPARYAWLTAWAFVIMPVCVAAQTAATPQPAPETLLTPAPAPTAVAPPVPVAVGAPPPAAGAPASGAAAGAAMELQEVTVAAPQPRYVASTTRDRIGRIWAPVYLNGKGPFRLVLDTGANRSAIIPTVATALGESARTTSQVRLRGVTGTSIVPVVKVDRMEIGDLVLAPVKLPVVPDVFGGADGVLGNEGLMDKRIVIDFRHDSITVKRSHRERPPNGFQTLPVTFLRDHLLSFDVRVGRVTAKAIVDTGAPDSVGNLALLRALKREAKQDPQTDIVGVTLDVEKGDYVRVPTISMQNVKIRGAGVTFSDVYIFKHWRMIDEPAILLGMDVIGVLDEIIIDYRTREIHLQTRG